MTATGKQIRVARAGLGTKLKELAAAARISPTTLSKIENGANAYEKTLLRLRGELVRRGAGRSMPSATRPISCTAWGTVFAMNVCGHAAAHARGEAGRGGG